METTEETVKRVIMILSPDDVRIIKKGGLISKRIASVDAVFEICYKE